MTSKKQSKPSAEIQFFKTPEEFRKWLAKNGASSTEIIVGYYKVGTGKKSITWPQSVDEALCFGWIDGVRKRIDDDAYQIRFTPRRKDSIWSTVNIERVKVLTAEGRMTEPGLQAFERRTERRSSIYAYEQSAELQLDESELRLFRKNKTAWKHLKVSPQVIAKECSIGSSALNSPRPELDDLPSSSIAAPLATS